jgi:hypothetical protein
MVGKIYLLQGNGSLQPMDEQPYPNEDLLQTLLENYPDLLAGEQINEASPRRWLFVSREFGVPESEGGPDRWSLDHLFLDQEAIPTLIEVKRSSDTRIRREVVGQMLDYAANSMIYWPAGVIREKFELACESRGNDPNILVTELLGVKADDSDSIENFWNQVKTNLQAGRIRLIFVADIIPKELQRIVEFLNEQMDPAEVLAIEIRQYVGEGLKTLVPKVIGQTSESDNRKLTAPTGVKWDETSFLQQMTARRGPAETEVAKAILKWAKEKADRIWWGEGKTMGYFSVVIEYKGTSHYPIAVSTIGVVYVSFYYLKLKPPFDNEDLRKELLKRINEIPGVNFPQQSITKGPSIPLKILESTDARNKFYSALEWAIQQIKSS